MKDVEFQAIDYLVKKAVKQVFTSPGSAGEQAVKGLAKGVKAPEDMPYFDSSPLLKGVGEFGEAVYEIGEGGATGLAGYGLGTNPVSMLIHPEAARRAREYGWKGFQSGAAPLRDIADYYRGAKKPKYDVAGQYHGILGDRESSLVDDYYYDEVIGDLRPENYDQSGYTPWTDPRAYAYWAAAAPHEATKMVGGVTALGKIPGLKQLGTGITTVGGKFLPASVTGAVSPLVTYAAPGIAEMKYNSIVNKTLAEHGMPETNLATKPLEEAVEILATDLKFDENQIEGYVADRQLREVSDSLTQNWLSQLPEDQRAAAVEAGQKVDLRDFSPEEFEQFIADAPNPEQAEQLKQLYNTYQKHSEGWTLPKGLEPATYSGGRPVDVLQRPEGQDYSVSVTSHAPEHNLEKLKVLTVGREDYFKQNIDKLFAESTEGNVSSVQLVNPKTGIPLTRDDFKTMPTEDLIALSRVAGEAYPNLPITSELADAAYLRMQDMGSDVDISGLLTSPQLATPEQAAKFREQADAYNQAYKEALKGNGAIVDPRTGRPAREEYLKSLTEVQKDAYVDATGTLVKSKVEDLKAEEAAELASAAAAEEFTPDQTEKGQEELAAQTGVENPSMLMEMWNDLDAGSKAGVVLGLPLMFIGAMNSFNGGVSGMLGFMTLLGGGLAAAGSTGMLGTAAQGFINTALDGLGKMIGFEGPEVSKVPQEGIESDEAVPESGIDEELSGADTMSTTNQEELVQLLNNTPPNEVGALLNNLVKDPQYSEIVEGIKQQFQKNVREAQKGWAGRWVTPERAVERTIPVLQKKLGLSPEIARATATYIATNFWPS